MLNPSFNSSRDNYYGKLDAPIEIIEYGDFQCRKCAALFGQIRILQDIMGDKLRFVYRHFPLLNIHPLSLEAAIASEAAALQHKFWQMHSMIYHNQDKLSRITLLELAEDINMDMALFTSSREQECIFKKVVHDFNSAVMSGVTNTASFFINGFLYTGKPDFKSLYKLCRYLLEYKKEREGFY